MSKTYIDYCGKLIANGLTGKPAYGWRGSLLYFNGAEYLMENYGENVGQNYSYSAPVIAAISLSQRDVLEKYNATADWQLTVPPEQDEASRKIGASYSASITPEFVNGVATVNVSFSCDPDIAYNTPILEFVDMNAPESRRTSASIALDVWKDSALNPFNYTIDGHMDFETAFGDYTITYSNLSKVSSFIDYFGNTTNGVIFTRADGLDISGPKKDDGSYREFSIIIDWSYSVTNFFAGWPYLLHRAYIIVQWEGMSPEVRPVFGSNGLMFDATDTVSASHNYGNNDINPYRELKSGSMSVARVKV